MNWEKDEKQILNKAKAPIEHVFDNHLYCSETWCYKLKAQKEGKVYHPPPNRPFYCKTKDSKMYKQLVTSLSRFQTSEALKESMHFLDTQSNEAMNQAVARFCPKFKHFGTTMTLATRVHLAIHIRNKGYKECYLELFNKLGIKEETNRNLFRFVHRNDTKRTNQYKRNISADYKRSRKHK